MIIDREDLKGQVTYGEVKKGQAFVANGVVYLKTEESPVNLETGGYIGRPHDTVFVLLYSKATLKLGECG